MVTLPLSPTKMNDNSGRNSSGNRDMLEDMQIVTKLLSFGQSLCGQRTPNTTKRLCQELSVLTQGRVMLFLNRQCTGKRKSSSSSTIPILPIQFGDLCYGTLSIASDPINTRLPVISPPLAQLLAQTCGWLLYTLEQSAFVHGQCQGLDYQMHRSLTKREREVLELMCRGYNQEAIAKRLCISPATVGKHRQHIYDTLGVHRERDALLAAYHSGLFSFVDEKC